MTHSSTPSLHDALPIFIEPLRHSRGLKDAPVRSLGSQIFRRRESSQTRLAPGVITREPPLVRVRVLQQQDRKSTRLNSSHRCSSYAVFCLKKKIKLNIT